MNSNNGINWISSIPMEGRKVKRLLKIISTVLILSVSGIISAQIPNWLLANSSYGGDIDSSESIAIDNAGNLYLTGYYSDTFDGEFWLGDNVQLVGLGAFAAKYNVIEDCIWAKPQGWYQYSWPVYYRR